MIDRIVAVEPPSDRRLARARSRGWMTLRTLVLCMFTILLPRAADAQALSPREAATVDSVANAELSAWRAPGMVLAVVRDDGVALRRAYGLANVETGELMRPELIVSVASVSKPITAVTAVVLALRGEVDLAVPVRTYLPYLPDGLGAVTLDQVLSHTAGFGERTPQVPTGLDGSLTPVCRAMTDSSLVTAPGRTWGYSNTAYVLAGCVVEAAAGVPFPRAVAENLFQPLGMERSSFDPLFAMTFPHAQGHETRGQTRSVVRPFDSYRPIGPAGELVTTVDDLGRLARTLLNDGLLDGARVLPAGVLAEMSRPRGHGGALLGGTRDYGLGIMIRSHRGIEILEHEGVYSGFGASFVLAPRRGLAAIGVVNGRYSFPARTTQAAIEIAAGMAPSPTEPVTVHISPHRFTRRARRLHECRRYRRDPDRGRRPGAPSGCPNVPHRRATGGTLGAAGISGAPSDSHYAARDRPVRW